MQITFLSKSFFLKLFVALWMVFSVGYIGWNIWGSVKNGLMGQAYQQGVTDVINQLIQTAENNNCKAIPIFNKDQKKSVELVNATCLAKPK